MITRGDNNNATVCLITGGDNNNATDKRISVFRKKVNMDLNRCYQRCAEYFGITFSFAAPLTYQEWINDISATSAAEVSSTADERSGICREQTKKCQGEKGNKRESWTKEQSAIIVNLWKDLFQEIETFKQPSSWLKMKNEIDKKGLSKLLT